MPGLETKPTWTEWRYRLQDPSLFEKGTYRRVRITSGVTLITAKLKSTKKYANQSLRFSKEKFPKASDVKAWLKGHDEFGKMFSMANLYKTYVTKRYVRPKKKKNTSTTESITLQDGNAKPTKLVLHYPVDASVNLGSPLVKDEEIQYLFTLCHSISMKIHGGIEVEGWTIDSVSDLYTRVCAEAQKRKLITTAPELAKTLNTAATTVFAGTPNKDQVIWLTSKTETPTLKLHDHLVFLDEMLNGMTAEVLGHRHQIVSGVVREAQNHTHELLST